MTGRRAMGGGLRGASSLRLLCAAFVVVAIAGPSRAQVEAFELEPDTRIAVVGGSFAEQMFRHGWLEAALHARAPEGRLVVRNLGWSGDEPGLQPREQNFGSMIEHLRQQRAQLIIACWGMNASFRGEPGLASFEADLHAWVRAVRAERFDAELAPRILLVSPIAHEDLGDPLPDGRAHNRDLARFTRSMARLAEEHGLRFVDLFTPTQSYYHGEHDRPLTSNGIHPTDYGYWWLSREIARQLGWLDPGAEAVAADRGAAEQIEALRRAIWDKSWHFFLRWRPVNMEYIRGRRREPFGVEDFPREFEQLDALIDERDRRIWALPKPGLPQLWSDAPRAEGRRIWETLPTAGASGSRAGGGGG